MRKVVLGTVCATLLAGSVALALPAWATRPPCVRASGGVTCVDPTATGDGAVRYRWQVYDDRDGRHSFATVFYFVGDGPPLSRNFVVFDGESNSVEEDAPYRTTGMQLRLCLYREADPNPPECVTGARFPVRPDLRTLIQPARYIA